MSGLEAVVLGIIQGFTEFLPVSSSGHLTIAGTLLGMNGEENLAFVVLVHVATVLSTVVVLRNEVAGLFGSVFAFRWDENTQTVSKILLSMLPVGIVGLLFKDTIETFFGSGLPFVGFMLLLTAALLALSYLAEKRRKNALSRDISFRDAFIIGVAQACAVMPGLSRSGATIATGLMLGNSKEKVAKFSFLMVILPVLGEALLDVFKVWGGAESSLSAGAMIGGFAAAFISGAIACRWMINLVKRGKLIYFACYCVIAGVLAICYGL